MCSSLYGPIWPKINRYPRLEICIGSHVSPDLRRLLYSIRFLPLSVNRFNRSFYLALYTTQMRRMNQRARWQQCHNRPTVEACDRVELGRRLAPGGWL